MNESRRYMFDTNVFNRILDGAISLHSLAGRIEAYATHIQRDEINNTTDPARRAALAQVFREVVEETIPTDSCVLDVSRLDEARSGGERVVKTESAVWGVSRYGQAKYAAEDSLCSALKDRLDRVNGSKPNNAHDALIAETAIKKGYVLVTDDSDLAAVTKEYGGQCLSVAELLLYCNEGSAT